MVHPVSVPWWGLLGSQRKMSNFRKFTEGNLGVIFPPEKQRNPPGMLWRFREVNWEIFCADWKTCIPDWSKNCQKTLWNITLAFKASLRVGNWTHYTNHQMNNAVKNQIYSKAKYISLDWLFDMMCETIVSLSPTLV